MRWPRFRFSIRTLLIAVTVIAAVLGLSIRFGPHVVYKLVTSPRAVLQVVPRWDPVPIPSKPLIATKPDEVLVRCEVGPLSFEMPESISGSITVHRGGLGSGCVQFDGDGRSILFMLPQPYDNLFHDQVARFPGKEQLTFARLYEEIATVRVDDFSWSMSHQELRWHQWLLANRAHIGIQIDSIECLWRPDLEGNLLWFPAGPSFTWNTVDRQWQGAIIFKGTSPDDHDWIRHLCATFVIEGDLGELKRRTKEEIEELVMMREVEMSP